MDKQVRRTEHSQSGFSLLEVMIALTLFAVFVTVFVSSQGYNLSDSATMEEELRLRRLAEQVISEVVINPPELTSLQTLRKETKSFEGEDSGYKYTIEYALLELPDLSASLSQDKEGEDASGSVEKQIFTKVKESVKKVLWQVRVTTENKESKQLFTLARWVINPKAKVEIKL